MPEIERNLRAVQLRIANAAMRAKRDPKDITLIAVSKTFPAEAILAAFELGIRNFGENRVEEAMEKIPRIGLPVTDAQAAYPPDRPSWHLIGHLQSRKVKDAVPLFDYIHSVDSVELAERIERRAAERDKTISILLEINAAEEKTKFGFPIQARQNFFDAARRILGLPNLNVVGLMTIAPMAQESNDARPRAAFRALRLLRDELQARHATREHPLLHLSMGMTNDFEIAIEEGATMIRVGRAIFGERT